MTDLHDDEQFNENYTKIFKFPLPHPISLHTSLKKLWDAVDKQDALSKITFLKPRKKGEKSRQVLREMKVLKYALSPKSKHPISVTLVQAKELNPPKGKSPIVWRIMTNRDILNESQAIEIIDWYRCHWEVEMFFDVLKVGCRVERLQLATRER